MTQRFAPTLCSTVIGLDCFAKPWLTVTDSKSFTTV